MAIQVKFLEQWADYLNSSRSHSSYFEGQQDMINTIVDIAKKQHPKYKTLKSYIRHELDWSSLPHDPIEQPRVSQSTEDGGEQPSLSQEARDVQAS